MCANRSRLQICQYDDCQTRLYSCQCHFTSMGSSAKVQITTPSMAVALAKQSVSANPYFELSIRSFLSDVLWQVS